MQENLKTIEDLRKGNFKLFNEIKKYVALNIEIMKIKYPNKSAYQMIEQEYLNHYNYPFKGFLLAN